VNIYDLRILHGSPLHSALGHWEFLSTNISQVSLVTCLKCGGIFNHRSVRNLLLNLSVKKLWRLVSIWHSFKIVAWHLFFRTWCIFMNSRYISKTHVCNKHDRELTVYVLKCNFKYLHYKITTYTTVFGYFTSQFIMGTTSWVKSHQCPW